MTTLSKNARVAGLIYIVGSLVAVVRLIYIPSTLIVSENTTAIDFYRSLGARIGNRWLPVLLVGRAFEELAS